MYALASRLSYQGIIMPIELCRYTVYRVRHKILFNMLKPVMEFDNETVHLRCNVPIINHSVKSLVSHTKPHCNTCITQHMVNMMHYSWKCISCCFRNCGIVVYYAMCTIFNIRGLMHSVMCLLTQLLTFIAMRLAMATMGQWTRRDTT